MFDNSYDRTHTLYMTNSNNSPLRNAIRIFTFANTMGGDYHATARQLARFTTESLVDAAELGVAGMSTRERDMFGPRERITNRESALSAICSVVHSDRMRDFSASMDRARAAATRSMPEALELLAAAL